MSTTKHKQATIMNHRSKQKLHNLSETDGNRETFHCVLQVLNDLWIHLREYDACGNYEFV